MDAKKKLRVKIGKMLEVDVSFCGNAEMFSTMSTVKKRKEKKTP